MDIFQYAKRLLLFSRSVLTLALPVLALAACGSKPDPAAAPVPTVSVIRVSAATIPVIEEYAAQTEAVETVEIRSRVGGILERQAFQDGARLHKGQLLFVIDRQPYLTALDLAKAALAQAQAAALNSRQNLERVRPLLAEQAISQQDLDAAVARERADAASVEAAAAQVRQAQLNLGYTSVSAPRDGIVGKALLKPGGLVNASTTLLTTLYSSDPIYVNFAIGEQRMLVLQKQWQGHSGAEKHQQTPFGLKLVDGSNYPFSGKLNFVDAAVDPRSGTLQIRLSVPNPERILRPGQFMRVALSGQKIPNAILVPQKAVQEIQGKRSVFVIGADNKAGFREIVANTRSGNDWVVEGGLAPGEVVVVDGLQKIKPGTTVKAELVPPKPAATSAGGS